jgi:hypothetical protein
MFAYRAGALSGFAAYVDTFSSEQLMTISLDTSTFMIVPNLFGLNDWHQPQQMVPPSASFV